MIQEILTYNNCSSTKASTLSTHVLDTSTGTPAKNLKIKLEKLTSPKGTPETWQEVCNLVTNEGTITNYFQLTPTDGRAKNIPSIEEAGTFRITFDTASYFEEVVKTDKYFYPYCTIVFKVDVGQHYHVPLLISPFGYSTYRGS
jgi:5-hydroxyisourate hydrolase